MKHNGLDLRCWYRHLHFAAERSWQNRHWNGQTSAASFSLVNKDLFYEAKAKSKTFFLKAKAKDMKIFQGQRQGQLRQLLYDELKFALQ